MLKRFAILAATLAAVAISLVGAQEALAANPVHPAQGPTAQPTASAVPGANTSQDPMAGMSDEEMAGMNHEEPATAAASEDSMAGMSDEEMAGMNHEEPAGSSHAGTEAAPAARPLAAVVGSFVAVNGAVLAAAGLMRRRDKRAAVSSPKTSRSSK